MPEREYTRLTPVRQRGGLAVVSASRSNLWLAKDHLLSVETEGYTESYKRFYFRDIQAVTLRKTSRMQVIALVTGSFTVLFVVGLVLSASVEAAVIFGILTALCAIPFGLNLLYGPTCSCHLRTAVQTGEVPSLSRVRRARKVLARLQPLIAAAQGGLDPDQLPQRMQELAADAAAASSARAADPNAPPIIAYSAAERTPEAARDYRGTAHLVLCWILVADLPLTLPTFFMKSTGYEAFGFVHIIAAVVGAIVAIVKQSRSLLPQRLKVLPWITIANMTVFVLAGLGYGFVVAVRPADYSGQIPSFKEPFNLAMACLSTTFNFIPGVLGLWWLRQFRASLRQPPPPAGDTSATVEP